MNRLHQLKETLPRNITDNEGHENLEFIILDYNSNDGLQGWVAENLEKHLSTGRVVYYRTEEPNEFSHSHAKNTAFKLASGKIVCNINADHFTGKNFAKFINTRFRINENIVLTPIDFHKTKKGFSPPKDVFGKVCVMKSAFLKVGGFDERMTGYGFEDWDFINRLELIGIKRELIEDLSYLQYISHGNGRISNDQNEILSIYVNHINPSMSTLLLLYENGICERSVVVDNSTINSEDFRLAFTPRDFVFEFSLMSGWGVGRWRQDLNSVSMIFNGEEIILGPEQDYKPGLFVDLATGTTFHRILNQKTIDGILDFKFTLSNRTILENSLKDGAYHANEGDFGNAVVYKNFNTSIPIYL